MSTFMSRDVNVRVRYSIWKKADRRKLAKAIWKYKYIYLMVLPVFSIVFLF